MPSLDVTSFGNALMPSPKSPIASAGPAPASDAVQSALRTLEVGSQGIAAVATALKGPLGSPFAETVALIHQAAGRVIVTGIGKSGHVARKIAATLASTGTPAFFVHTAEASHGDLGMITPDDVIVALSWSGEQPEMKNLVN
jgi:arabinose-5-phosphate isomerase